MAVFILAVAALATAAGGQAQKAGAAQAKAGEGKALQNPVPATEASVKAGRLVFVKYCAPCHGNSGRGNGGMAPEGSKPADFTDEKWEHGSTDGELFVTIRDGVGPKFDMDSWASTLTPQDMWNVINYIRTLGPKK